VNITIAHPSEADALTEIAFVAKRSWGYPEHWIEHWCSLLTVTPDFVATHATYAARDDQGILGFSALAQSAGILCLEHLWVSPSATGRGVGRALFHRARQRARDLGFATFEIESDPHAAGFYERMGAERIGANTTFLDANPANYPPSGAARHMNPTEAPSKRCRRLGRDI
jgi:GNAT superfamily N-acetyltransferase